MVYPSGAFERMVSSSQEIPISIRRAVEKILIQVQRRGDKALVDLTRRFDGVSLTIGQLRVKDAELAGARVSPEFLKAAQVTLKSVETFARASLPKNWSRMNPHGARVGEKFDPLRRVGIYVPGGSVPLVSTVFMTVALARVAGVKEIVVCTPPPVAEPLLWALRRCGATEVYRLGGAQAMAALAYGTRTIRPVDKLFGPGNVYLTEAKRQLFGTVGVDLLAGPSELMILADETARVDWAAADLLAQAEHGSGRERVYCVSSSKRVLNAVANSFYSEAASQKKNRGLARVIREGVWWIKVRDRESMMEVANRLAPEHLQIMTRNARALGGRIVTAGAIFLGNQTPTVLGDFVAGPSHTLPTTGAGKAFSGLRVMDFMRRTSMVEYGRLAIARAKRGVLAFARAEHLPLHGRSAEARVSSELKKESK